MRQVPQSRRVREEEGAQGQVPLRRGTRARANRRGTRASANTLHLPELHPDHNTAKDHDDSPEDAESQAGVP